MAPTILLDALGEATAGEAMVQVATPEAIEHRRSDDHPPEALSLRIALPVNGLELRKQALDQQQKREKANANVSGAPPRVRLLLTQMPLSPHLSSH
jgi:hypothetical protein